MMLTCQACERAPFSVEEETDDPSEPYRLCPACHARLLARSLRPVEWFNLAKRHGWTQPLLHDDLYNEDGSADQPDEDVVAPEAFPAPTLSEASRSAEALLDFSITRWWLRPEVIDAWSRIPVDEALAALTRRFETAHNDLVRGVVLEVTATVGPAAAAFTRQIWRDGAFSDGLYGSLVRATAGSLPLDEGFALAESALKRMPEKVWRGNFPALAHFKSERTLAWIEANAGEPSVGAWGGLAAASSFSWGKAKAWLESGRPLSLIAVDALIEVLDPRSRPAGVERLRLASTATEEETRPVLESAMAADPVPRMKQRIGWLLSQLPALAAASVRST